MRLTRRDLLLGTAAMGLAACGPRTPQTRALELWTLQLAPKFNPYFADVLGAWGGFHPRCARALDGFALGVGGTQVAGGGVCAHGPGCGEPQSALRSQSGQQGGTG